MISRWLRAGLLACGLMLVIDAGVALASVALSYSACCRDDGCVRRILSGGLVWTCKASGIISWVGYLVLVVCSKVNVAREKVEARFMVVLELEMTLVVIAAVAWLYHQAARSHTHRADVARKLGYQYSPRISAAVGRRLT